MGKDNGIHSGHRQRMRSKFIADGDLSEYHTHQILEMLLFYAIPRGDTNPLAHRLIDSFGTLKGVFDAPLPALMEIEGVGENTAVLIKLIPALIRAYYDDESGYLFIRGVNSAVDFLGAKFAASPIESFIVVYVNNAGKVLRWKRASTGTPMSTTVDIRKVIIESLGCNASNILIAHNHPSGINSPSDADIAITKKIMSACETMNINFLDHIIITDNNYYSFAHDSDMADQFSLKNQHIELYDSDWAYDK